MPIPTPEAGQSHDEYMKLCMGDDMMNEDYPDEKQRLAVCQQQWDDIHEDDSRSLAVGEQETRTFELDSLETRAVGEGEAKKIRGHAAVFNKLSEDLGGFREMFEPRSFRSSIKKDDIRSLYNHNPSFILGRNKAKPAPTLTIEEDEQGVYFEVSPPDNTYAQDCLRSIERGDISQCSIIFSIDGKKGERWLVDGKEVEAMDAFMAMWDGKKHDIERHVVKARLYDVGPVTFPCYVTTDVKVRSMEAREKLKLPPAPKLDEALARDGAAARLVRARWKLR